MEKTSEHLSGDPKSPQTFAISLRLTTECRERLTATDVLVWTESIFEGCDVGNVEVVGCTELP